MVLPVVAKGDVSATRILEVVLMMATARAMVVLVVAMALTLFGILHFGLSKIRLMTAINPVTCSHCAMAYKYPASQLL